MRLPAARAARAVRVRLIAEGAAVGALPFSAAAANCRRWSHLFPCLLPSCLPFPRRHFPHCLIACQLRERGGVAGSAPQLLLSLLESESRRISLSLSPVRREPPCIFGGSGAERRRAREQRIDQHPVDEERGADRER